MDGRTLLAVGRDLAAGPTEAHCRSSVGRAYYALLHEVLGALRRWGIVLHPRDKVHTFARLKFVYASDPDLKRIGLTLEALAQLRNAADYQLGAISRAQGDRFSAELWPSPQLLSVRDALSKHVARPFVPNQP